MSFISSRQSLTECYHRVYCCTLSRRLRWHPCRSRPWEKGLSSMASVFSSEFPSQWTVFRRSRGEGDSKKGVGCHAMYDCFYNVGRRTWPARILLVGKTPIVCMGEVRLRGPSSIDPVRISCQLVARSIIPVSGIIYICGDARCSGRDPGCEASVEDRRRGLPIPAAATPTPGLQTINMPYTACYSTCTHTAYTSL